MAQLIFQRPQEREELIHLLRKGDSILMVAPRRIGKTWLMHRVAEDVSAEWDTVFCDVEGIRMNLSF